jgi:PUA domain protein
MDDPLIPHLSLVHKYPQCFDRIRIDRGAIRFVLSGAALMVPGLTSPGGRLPDPSVSEDDKEANDGYGGKELQAGDIVVVEAEGKASACLVGVLKMSTKDMKEKKKGVGLENGHYLGDGLWNLSL